MSDEKDVVLIETLVDILLMAYQTGKSIEEARESDGRIGHSTWFNLKRSSPGLFQTAQERAMVIIAADRAERVSGVYREVADSLLSEMKATVARLIQIRDTARSDFTALQASSALLAWAAKMNDAVLEPREEPRQLPPPKRGRGISDLLASGVVSAVQEVKLQNGTVLTERATRPQTVDA